MKTVEHKVQILRLKHDFIVPNQTNTETFPLYFSAFFVLFLSSRSRCRCPEKMNKKVVWKGHSKVIRMYFLLPESLYYNHTKTKYVYLYSAWFYLFLRGFKKEEGDF